MDDSEKKTLLWVVVAIVGLYLFMKMKGTSAGNAYTPGFGTVPNSPPSNTGFNPYLPQGNASGPSPGGATPSDTGQWINFGSGIFTGLSNLGVALVNKYGGSNADDGGYGGGGYDSDYGY